jgi:hypothetical protein
MTPIPPEARLDVSTSTPTLTGRDEDSTAATAAPRCHWGPVDDAPSAGLRRRGAGGFDVNLAEAVFAVGGGLPVADLAVAGDPGTARAAAAALWMARIWGNQQGYACLCLGLGSHLNSGGSYLFARFTQSFHPWPAGRLRLLARAIVAAADADVYVGVLLRARASRRAGTALAGRVAWADVDGSWTSQRAQALKRLDGRPIWQVQSGSGRHLYLPLDELEPPERLEGWNRRLAALLDADAGWSETKLLRLPGTFNHKPRASGNRPTPVVWLP